MMDRSLAEERRAVQAPARQTDEWAEAAKIGAATNDFFFEVARRSRRL
jgi:hypothetical protein